MLSLEGSLLITDNASFTHDTLFGIMLPYGGKVCLALSTFERVQKARRFSVFLFLAVVKIQDGINNLF